MTLFLTLTMEWCVISEIEAESRRENNGHSKADAEINEPIKIIDTETGKPNMPHFSSQMGK